MPAYLLFFLTLQTTIYNITQKHEEKTTDNGNGRPAAHRDHGRLWRRK